MALFRNGIIGIILILIALVFSVTPIQDFDIWWHLKLGELLSKDFNFLSKDTLSYTAYGGFYQNHSWLASLLLHFLYSGFGFDGIFFLVFLVTFGITLFFYKTIARHFPDSWGVNLLLTFVLLWSLSDRIATRPHIWTLFFLSLYFYLLFHPDRDKSKWLLFLIPLQILWANLHGGFVFGIALVWLVAFGTWIDGRFKKIKDSKIRLKRLYVVGLCVVLASMVSPFTFDNLLYPLKHADFHFITHYTAEWLSPFSPLLQSALSVKFFKAVLIILFFTFVFTWRSFSFVSFFVAVFATVMACKGRRFLPNFMLLTTPLILFQWRSTLFGLGERIKPYQNWFQAGAVILLLLVSLNFYMFGVVKVWDGGYSRTFVGRGILPNADPKNLIRFLEENEIRGRVFNDSAIGGYLLFSRPQEKVFIDGRTPLYGDHFYGRTVSAFLFPPGEFERLEKEYQFDYVVMPTDDAWLKADFHAYLWGRPDWVLVYYSPEGALYLKDLPKFQKVIKKHRLLTSPILEEMKKEDRPPRLFHESDIPKDFKKFTFPSRGGA